MTQAFGVILAAMLTGVASVGYMYVFFDEFNEQAPVNRNAEGFTPLRRHCVEMLLIQMSTFLTATAIYCGICESDQGPRLDWPKVRFFLFWLHVISGGVILTGLIVAMLKGQAVHVRDGVTASVGVVLLAFSAWDLFGSREKSGM